jgi:phage recombination protein Bet
MAKQETNTAVAEQPKAEKEITYDVAGQDVKLSYSIVRSFLVKGGGTVSDQDIVLFMSICKYNQLNPFLNEAYLVKFGTNPAQMIVSKEAFMKRAEACEDYEGFQAGVIVLRGNEAVEIEGSFYLPTDKLVGGWAKVYRKDKKFPIVSKVSLDEYDKGQSVWKEKKSTMIRKVPLVQALREAFPAQLGAMYTAEETGVVDGEFTDLGSKVKAAAASGKSDRQTISIDPVVESKPEEVKVDPPKNKDPKPAVEQSVAPDDSEEDDSFPSLSH